MNGTTAPRKVYFKEARPLKKTVDAAINSLRQTHQSYQQSTLDLVNALVKYKDNGKDLGREAIVKWLSALLVGFEQRNKGDNQLMGPGGEYRNFIDSLQHHPMPMMRDIDGRLNMLHTQQQMSGVGTPGFSLNV